MDSLGLGGFQSLSRGSDHLRGLANLLRDLTGGEVLLHELIQNADDAGADTIRFRADEHGLTVWNPAVFTSCRRQDLESCPDLPACDLHRFRLVNSRGKYDDISTTGAFGVGFTAVYQVTDHPELITGGFHLLLDEARESNERIRLCTGCDRRHDEGGTTFVLPWARATSRIRQVLGQPLSQSEIESLLLVMGTSAERAGVFLQHVKRIEVLGPQRQTVATKSVFGDRIETQFEGDGHQWLLLRADTQEPPPGNRSRCVEVAIDTRPGAAIGSVYATLPTQTTTGWAGHINGSFFPSLDRKAVDFQGAGESVRWNAALIETASELVATNLDHIAREVSPEAVWQYLADCLAMLRDPQRPDCFRHFYERARVHAGEAHITPLTDGRTVPPPGTVLPHSDRLYAHEGLLSRLGFPLVDSSVRPLVERTDYADDFGVRRLTGEMIAQALLDLGLAESWRPSDDNAMTAADAHEALAALDAASSASTFDAPAVRSVAIVPCTNGCFAPAQSVVRVAPDDRALFELLDSGLLIADEELLREHCPKFVDIVPRMTAQRALRILDADHGALAVAPVEVLQWLADHQRELGDPDLREVARRLPIYPSADGRYRPLDELSLPSDFADELGLADVLDRRRIDGHQDFLKSLGARPLDGVEYLTRHVLPVAETASLTSQQAVTVLELIQRVRQDLERDEASLGKVRRANLIACVDGSLRSPAEVHLPSDSLSLIDPGAPVASLEGLPASLRETLVWLGVHPHPSETTIVRAAEDLAAAKQSSDFTRVEAILDAVPEAIAQRARPASHRLMEIPWLPDRSGALHRPQDLYLASEDHLVGRDEPLLAISATGARRETLTWLGVQPRVPASMVVRHLQDCMARQVEVDPRVYARLGDDADRPQVQALRSQACIQLGAGRYVTPDEVFWDDPRLGSWAYRLPEDYKRYAKFLDAVGVQRLPTPDQAAALLLRIEKERARQVLDDNDSAAVRRCWQVLNDAAKDRERPDIDNLLTQLGESKTALDARAMLERPKTLVFRDARGLAARFPVIHDSLIPRSRKTSTALEAAGVKDAAQLIAEDPRHGEAWAATALQDLLYDRLPALLRAVMSSHDGDAMTLRGRMERLSVLCTDDLTVTYALTYMGRLRDSHTEAVEAFYNDEAHALLLRDLRPSPNLARELVRALGGGVDDNGTASTLLLVLQADSLSDALETLDELGIPAVDGDEFVSIPSAEAPTTTGVLPPTTETDEGVLVADTRPAEQSDLDSTLREEIVAGPSPGQTLAIASGDGIAIGNGPFTASMPGQTFGHGRGLGGDRLSRSHAGSTPGNSNWQDRRMVSYVSSTSSRSAGSWTGGSRSRDIESAALRIVEQWEKDQGREPLLRSETEGIDFVSRDSAGTARHIEVKGLSGHWGEYGVYLTATQFQRNRELGDQYWMYVVTDVDSEAPSIHMIHNPVSRIDRYAFDHGWMQSGEVADQYRCEGSADATDLNAPE